MPTILPFDIIVQIIDTVGENEDTNLLKELALVSHCFHQICSKHLFATVDLHDTNPTWDTTSSKRGFVKLLKSRPDIVKHIRKLTYELGYTAYEPTSDDRRLSPILPNLLRTISRLNHLTITASYTTNWNETNPSLKSALLHLMHLPTIDHIDLSLINGFPLSSLFPSVNLLRLHICGIEPLQEEIVVQSEMMPKIRVFHNLDSSELTTKLLHAKKHDGRPAFNFMDLRRLSICLENKRNVRYFVQNAKLLERLHLSLNEGDQSFEGLHDILSASAGTLKALDLTLSLYEDDDDGSINLPFEGLCEELKAMAGHNMLEALSLEVEIRRNETAESIGSMIQNVEKVLVKPGWSALRQVTFKVPVACCLVRDKNLSEALRSLLPDKYLSHLSKLESVAFNFSSYVVKC